MTLFGKKGKAEEESVVNGPPVPAGPDQIAAANAPRTVPEEKAGDGTTCFGRNLRIAGTVSGEGHLVILGAFEGEFDLNGQLEVAQGARIKGNFRATRISVNGNAEGTFTASEKFHLDNNARITGRLVTPKITILDGAVFDGELQMGKRPLTETRLPEVSQADAGKNAGSKKKIDHAPA